jgi:hypothetical protein
LISFFTPEQGWLHAEILAQASLAYYWHSDELQISSRAFGAFFMRFFSVMGVSQYRHLSIKALSLNYLQLIPK